jgi:hypothetical protein
MSGNKTVYRTVAMAVTGVLWGLAPFVALAADGRRDDVVFVAAAGDPSGCGPAPAGEPFNIAVEPRAETVKNAPFSGIGTTEVVTTLGDGNRIVRTNTMRYYRDSAGRTRTEYSLAAIGPFTPDQAQTLVTINDPIEGRRYVLNSELKRADVFKLGDFGVERVAGATGAVGPNKVISFGLKGAPPSEAVSTGIATRGLSMRPTTSTLPTGPRPIAPVVVMSRAGSLPPVNAGVIMPYAASDAANAGCKPGSRPLPSPTSLGERLIEGLKVTGTRMEFTIAQGAIGNEQPIRVSSEQWFSPDLGVVVSSSHRDPMMGDTSYRLEQISRTEPDASLFSVPSDYTKTDVTANVTFFKEAVPAAPVERDSGSR